MEYKISIWDKDQKYFKSFRDILELEEWYSQADVDNKDMGFFEVIEGPQRLYMDIDIPGDGDYFDLVDEQCQKIKDDLKIAVIPEVQYVKTRDNVYNNKKILILNPSLLTKSIKVLKKFINNNIGSLSEFGVKSLEKIMPVDEDKIFAKVTRGSEFFDKNYLHLDGLDQVCQKGEAKFCIEIDNIFVKENYVSIQIKVLDMIITKENVNIRRGPLIDVSR
ncbi:hypothetical protein LPJ55_004529 [Coemansia sp. RSA 990]|nr:hypothetical protein LPJ55_004529 [Coemansia sp. RSA 990]